jgi:hypothetical protein
MADYEKSGELKQLLGARTVARDGTPTILEQLIYQHRFRMNELGARGQAGVGAVAATSVGPQGEPKILAIDGSYLVWFKPNNAPVPFSAYITPKEMKEPASLR